MPAPEPLVALLGELGAMAPEDRAIILGALTRKERDLLDRVGPTIATQESRETGTSPWLAAHIHAARRGESAMTSSAREALLRAVGTPVREPQRTGRSLAGAFGGLLASRSSR